MVRRASMALTVFVVGVVVAAACSTSLDVDVDVPQAGAPVADDDVDASADPVRSPTLLEIDVTAPGEIQSLSPDGTLLLLTDGSQICLQPVVEEAEFECVAWPRDDETRRPRLVVTWAEDASRAVFFDRIEAAATFRAPVWDLDTDDLRLETIGGLDDAAPTVVALSPDGNDLAVGGRIAEGSAGLGVLSGSGDLTESQRTVPNFLHWLPDGSGLLGSAPFQGVERFGPDGAFEATVLAPDGDLGDPRLMSVSGTGDAALVTYPEPVAREFYPPDVSFFAVVDLESGAATPLKEGVGFVGPMAAVFSPDGERVAYLYHDGADVDAPLVLAVRPVAAAAETVLLDDASALGVPLRDTQVANPFAAPIWTEDRLLFPETRRVVVVEP